MSLYIDASAMVAMIVHESDAEQLVERFDVEHDRLCSAMSIWEAVSALSSSYWDEPSAARAHVERYAATFSLRYVAIGETESKLALDAYERFGKRSGHPARLNMGDCFAYACAKANGAKLLYKGDDFVHTDLA